MSEFHVTVEREPVFFIDLEPGGKRMVRAIKIAK